MTPERENFFTKSYGSHLAAVGLVGVATLVCEQARPYLSPTNMVMAYLLVVVIAALFLGMKQAILSAFLGVLAFDFFFVPPRFSLTIANKEYLVTFLALFTVGLVISTLVAQARERLEALQQRELQTAALYQLSKSLAAAADREGIMTALIRNIEQSLGAEVAVFLSEQETLGIAAQSPGLTLDQEELEIARWSFHSRRLAGAGSESYRRARLTYIPIRALAETIGVLAFRLRPENNAHSAQTRLLLHAFATQTAMALERVRLIQQAQEAQILKARENLERALLNSISHDLRTPLAAITGALSAVVEEGERLNDRSRKELLDTAREEAARLNRFVGNLLDMTRLEAGVLRPNLELCDVQELIGCGLAAVEKRLGDREVQVALEPDLPMVPMDLALMVQVLVNLLDNALKYAPEGEIGISARSLDGRLYLEIADRGPGLPEQDLSRVFDKFYRTPVPEGVGGTGLGLSICRGIVEAHGGEIRAANREGGGLRVIVVLPETVSDAGEGEA